MGADFRQHLPAALAFLTGRQLRRHRNPGDVLDPYGVGRSLAGLDRDAGDDGDFGEVDVSQRGGLVGGQEHTRRGLQARTDGLFLPQRFQRGGDHPADRENVGPLVGEGCVRPLRRDFGDHAQVD